MTGQELYSLGKNSPAGKACIPLNFSHTPPRIFREGTWMAEFWYYAVDYNDESVFEPQFYLLLELPSGNPVQMRRLSDQCRCLGPAPEVVPEDYYQQINRYLDDCAELLKEKNPGNDQLEAMTQQWLAVQPRLLSRWLARQNFTAQAPVQRMQPASEQPAEDLVAYWKQEMAKAVQSGDPHRIDKAQQQLLKAMQRRRN